MIVSAHDRSANERILTMRGIGYYFCGDYFGLHCSRVSKIIQAGELAKLPERRKT
uniref:Uncharacterized protein n=1 Tax=Candidatus Kentrum sp. MB TaxID=2138164 RepID=A0A451BH77_9GAMM|nr:MAG: hypothetical protein BECKMB1821G_GA0114241_11822 [Candidatus Kentron sp. MB]VFK77642.1 MAG: hypothetical protein BECKMB1821H_GA0114242_11972 [Candidatus Kentron sp. MB]VFK77644.1 MAG: hypothetical protein BECKMB1821H_GA0114242_11974 [Candidatus Kentron sp. MB]